MILARGDIPPIKLQNSVFLMGILVKSFKKVFRRQIPFFSKFVFSNCPPIKKILAVPPGRHPPPPPPPPSENPVSAPDTEGEVTVVGSGGMPAGGVKMVRSVYLGVILG